MAEARLSVPEGRGHIHGVYMNEAAEEPRIEVSPDLQAWRILADDGEAIATLYGLLLRLHQARGITIGKDAIHLAPRPGGAPWDPEAFETEVLDRLQGTFVIVTQGRLPRRLYPDTGGTLPIVYCARTRRIGASAGMVLEAEEYRERFLAGRVERLIRREGMGSWIPGTLTAHEGVSRLLSNHYLDLEIWEAVRFWPRPPVFAQEMEVEAAAALIAEALPAFVRAAAAEFRIGITLTAGFDSRLLLAAARDVTGRIEVFTTESGRPGLDQIMAARIAGDLGLTHRLAPLLPASEAEMALWDHAVGHAVLEGNRSSAPTLRSLPYDLILTGMFGEPGRARLYRRDFDRINAVRLTPEGVLSRLGRPRDPELLAEVSRWLEPLRWLPTSAILDLAHMELKGSGWAMAQHAAQNAAKLELNPIAQRSIRHAFLAVPPERKGLSALFQRSIEIMWPELMRYPVNRYGDWRDPLGKLSKVLSPRRVRGFLRARRA
jgi:hypothetical protein